MWQYKVYENFLDKSDFNKLKDGIVNDNFMKYHNFNDGQYRKWFDYDPTPQIADTLKDFDKHRDFEELKTFIHYAVTPKKFVHKVHDEAKYKVLSAIIYLSPEVSCGTFLHDKFENPSETIEVEWAPNTMMVFCGETDVTWHHFESQYAHRYTYNYFLVDPTKMLRPEYKQYAFGEDLSAKLRK